VVSFLLAFPPIFYIHSSSPHSYSMPYPSHHPCLEHSNYIRGRLQVLKLFSMQFSPTFRHFISLRSEYSQHPQSMFLP
jgi:hypothetical protein